MRANPKISIITVTFNSEDYISNAVDSVLGQSYKNIEYIVIDGKSTDKTVDILQSYKGRISKLISEKDTGIYDAMNKGISLASGDVVGILNSDDFYIDEFVIERVAKEFEKKIDCLYADLVYVRSNNLNKIVRYYDSSQFSPSKFAYGWMPAHPTFFVKKDIYNNHGIFRTDLKIAADFDLMVRLLYTQALTCFYMKEPIIKMRVGGVSTSFSSIWINNIETLRVCKDNGIKTNIFKILSKYPKKILGLRL
jgi:glycosyltransferase involved in cell wall biosynthesis